MLVTVPSTPTSFLHEQHPLRWTTIHGPSCRIDRPPLVLDSEIRLVEIHLAVSRRRHPLTTSPRLMLAFAWETLHAHSSLCQKSVWRSSADESSDTYSETT